MERISRFRKAYEHGNLLDAIRAGIEALGKTPETVTIDELAAADEFHIGGRQASEEFLVQLQLKSTDHVLDVGCGIGGTSRFAASRFGCRVTGIDLAPEFVATGRMLCQWVGLVDRVELQQGSALDLPFDAESFDAAFMLHVGMNIDDKAELCRQVFRVLKPDAVFGIYDVMQKTDAPLAYPVPWASEANTSFLATREEYQQHLSDAGFAITVVRDRRAFAADFFEMARQRVEAAGGPAPLGVHVVMGDDAPIKIRNMIDNFAAGCVSPVEVIASKV